MVVVVTIIAVLSAVTFVHLDRVVPAARFQRAAADVVGAARFARATARTTREEVSIHYDLDDESWSVYAMMPQESVDEESADEVIAGPPKRRDLWDAVYTKILEGRLPEGVAFRRVDYGDEGSETRGVAIATFRSTGAVGEHMVTLEMGRETRAVYVPALTGAAFVVADGGTYDEIHNAHRLE
jgi:hypothetical protein